MLAGLLGGLAVSITVPVADAVDSANNPEATDNPYQGITERNIFHLNPPPPPPESRGEQAAAAEDFFNGHYDSRRQPTRPPQSHSPGQTG